MARRAPGTYCRSGPPEAAELPRPAPLPKAAALRRALLAWYRREARDLPWRHSRDPFAIWLSEALLQQTQVATALAYYERLLARFPDVASLAGAREEELLELWSGLGYYRRARALLAAARQVVERHGGRVPTEREALLALPGVGPYTAGAVLSIAFGQAEPLVDGNVARVLARLFLLEDAPGSGPSERRLWSLARALLPPPGLGPTGPGAWNQALMELGATVCTPLRPRCEACPLERRCQARGAGRELELPRPRPRPAPLDVELELLVVRGPRGVLLERRASAGRMGGLWELPTRERCCGGGQPRLWPPAFAHPRLGVARPPSQLGVLRHAITRHRIRARLLAGKLTGRGAAPAGFDWWSPGRATAMPLSGLARKALDSIAG